MAGHATQTIAALATPAGRGGIGVIRISGPKASHIARQVLGHLPEPRKAEYLPFKGEGEEVLDQGIALFFPGPNSFTGEDVLELQGHGGPILLDLLLRHIFSLGVRPARPGEFSEQAFLNDKIDLAQAEAIADLINAGTEAAARSALRSMQGEFSKTIHELVEGLIQLRIYIEAAMDFADEEIDFLSDGKVTEQLADLQRRLADVQSSARQGSLLRDGVNAVIIGPPNAGKSSLLNRLSGRDSAIVTDIPGTTRDILREQIQIDGVPLHIIDTAGLRDTDCQVEAEGVRRARAALDDADLVMLVLDDSKNPDEVEARLREELPPGRSAVIIHNKIDLSGHDAGSETEGPLTRVWLSARQEIGLECLKDVLKKAIGYEHHPEGDIIARRRHLEAIERADQALMRGMEQLEVFQASELLAEELRSAQDALSEITGEFTSDDLLGRIFSSFCIGK